MICPDKNIGVVHLVHQSQQSINSSNIVINAFGFVFPVSGKTDGGDRGKTFLGFSADALHIVTLKKHFSMSPGTPFPDLIKIFLNFISAYLPCQLQNILCKKRSFWIAEFLIKSGGSRDNSHRKNHTLMGVYFIGSLEHGFFCLYAYGADREKQPFSFGLCPAFSSLVHRIQIGDNGLCADGKGLKIHVVMGAVVMTIYQPRLWCGRYFGH